VLLLLLAALFLGVASYGQVEEGESAEAPPVGQPPAIELVSAAGTQLAVAESSCVTSTQDGQGVGVCGDTEDMKPRELSLVRPGEEIVIRLRDASVTEGTLEVRRLSCDIETFTELKLEAGPETGWRVDIPPGQYELQVYADFEAPDGASGDVSGSLGIFVADDQSQKVIPVPDTFVGC
jgi:hypothetical protein